jgi:DNA-binding response OmpR family regulator
MIAITASATKSGDAVRGLDGGADEYMSKPLDLELFVVRVQNLLSRTPNGAPRAEVLRWKDVELVPEEHRVTVGGKEVELTHLEFKLLASFLRQPNRVLARSWLLQTVWGSTPGIATRTVDKHVETVRKKVPSISTRIETVVGVGYLFRP